MQKSVRFSLLIDKKRTFVSFFYILAKNNQNKTIMKKITLLFLLIVFAMNAQGQQVKGKVTDALGEPLPGVNVVVKGTDKGTVTNFDGHFELSGLSFHETLQFSYFGYQKKDILV
jgi:iron complex outermembrane receptor protein